MTKEEVLTKLAESRQALEQAIQGLSEEEMTQVTVEGSWTIKDVLGHLTSWEEVLLEPLRCYADGIPYETEVIEDYLLFNDEQAARKRALPLKVIVDELANIRQELVAAARRVPDERWEGEMHFPWGTKGPLGEALGGLSEHDLEHLHFIQAWRAERG